MVRVKPFAAVRPPKEYVEEVAARPYDVLNSAEAKAEASEKSLLHITKPEIDFDPIIDEHSQAAYGMASAGRSSVLLYLRPANGRQDPVRACGLRPYG